MSSNFGILLFSEIVFFEGLSLWNFLDHEYLAHWLCRQGSLTEPTRVEVGPDGHISAAVLNAKAAESRFTLEVESKSYTLDIDNRNTYRSKIARESTTDWTWRRGRICFAYPRAKSFASFDL